MHVTFLLPGAIATVSGGYGYDRVMIGGLRALGHTVEVVELGADDALGDPNLPAAARAAWAALPSDTVPVIDGLALRGFAPLAGEIAARRAIGLIHHPISLEPDWPDRARAALTAAERALFPAFAKVIVTSDWTARALAGFGVDAARVAVVQPGTAPAPRTRFAETGCEILALGSLEPRKGHRMLLRALSRLWDLDWHLTLAGQGADAAALRDLAVELKIADRVRFPGVLAGAALAEQWGRTDLFALATRFEGYGMAIAEALARGIPPAITNGGAAGSVVPDGAGSVTAVDDVVTYSKVLRRLIFDTDLRREMAEAAWRAGQKLPDWPHQVTLFANALETL